MVTSAISGEAEKGECFIVRDSLRRLRATFQDPLNQYVVLGSSEQLNAGNAGAPARTVRKPTPLNQGRRHVYTGALSSKRARAPALPASGASSQFTRHRQNRCSKHA
jgi:hypothetical protein